MRFTAWPSFLFRFAIFVLISIHWTFLVQDLEEFVMGSGESGFIYVSMGSSVKAAKMPEHLRQLFIRTFAQIPYRVIWKWESGLTEMKDLPPNVKIGTWLPQQDILGESSSIDRFQNVWSSFYSTPFFDRSSKIARICHARRSLEYVRKCVSRCPIGDDACVLRPRCQRS